MTLIVAVFLIVLVILFYFYRKEVKHGQSIEAEYRQALSVITLHVSEVAKQATADAQTANETASKAIARVQSVEQDYQKAVGQIEESISNVGAAHEVIREIVSRAKEAVTPSRYVKPDEEVVEKVRPFVEKMKASEMSGDQKRYQVLLAFMKEHPGHSVNQIENAIEEVLGKE